MQNDQQSVMNSLRNQGPEAWRAYLRPFEEGAPITGLSMYVIYHYAAPLAKDQLSLDWAEVAVRAADLEVLHSRGTERENAQLWAMKLRSWFIAKMGSRSDDLILDKQIVIDWVKEGLDLSVQAAKYKAMMIVKEVEAVKGSSNGQDRQRVHDELRHLRRIKQRLDVAKVLADGGALKDYPMLNDWLQIREQLP